MRRVRNSSQHSRVQRLGDSKMTLSPNFCLAVYKTYTPTTELDTSTREPLIPGLPEDVALNCLLRLPVESHSTCRCVSRRWRHLLGSKELFFTRRKEMGFKDPWLFIFSFHKCTGKIQWHVLDLKHFSWHSIPPMPSKERVCPHGVRCVSIPKEGTIYVCGGMISDVDCPLDLVFKYEIHRNKWCVLNQMNTARSFFASGVIDGLVYVAGGNSSNLLELDSAEVLDPCSGDWHFVSSMGTNMASYDSAVLNGKLLVTEGWLWPFYVSPRGRVYDPRKDRWEAMAVGLREGWTGSSVVMYSHLFVVSEHERMKVKVYDMGTDSWDTVDGLPLPEQICRPFTVNACDDRVYVVGRNLHVAVGVISSSSSGVEEEKLRFAIQWRVVYAPKHLCDFTPSSTEVLFA